MKRTWLFLAATSLLLTGTPALAGDNPAERDAQPTNHDTNLRALPSGGRWVARAKLVLARRQPGVDLLPVLGAQFAPAMGLHLAVLHVDDGDLLHLDPPHPVLGIHPEDHRAVLANAEVI